MLNLSLATFSTLLVVASLICLVAGRVAIRRRDVSSHRRRMLLACCLQTAFLAVFLTRLGLYGMVPFRHEGWLRGAYLVVLVSHEAVSVVTIPLVLVTLGFGLRGRLREHREIATVTWPTWVYASATGPIVYALLYLVP